MKVRHMIRETGLAGPVINLKFVPLVGEIDRDRVDDEIALLYSQTGRPGHRDPLHDRAVVAGLVRQPQCVEPSTREAEAGISHL